MPPALEDDCDGGNAAGERPVRMLQFLAAQIHAHALFLTGSIAVQSLWGPHYIFVFFNIFFPFLNLNFFVGKKILIINK